jgi:hypothetical protein
MEHPMIYLTDRQAFCLMFSLIRKIPGLDKVFVGTIILASRENRDDWSEMEEKLREYLDDPGDNDLQIAQYALVEAAMKYIYEETDEARAYISSGTKAW